MTQPPNTPGQYGPPNNGWQQQPPYGNDPTQPQYGPPGQAPYGPPGQPPYSGPGQAPYGGPGQAPYGGPGYGPGYPPGGPGYGGRGPRRTPLYIALGVVVVLVLLGVGVLLATRSSDNDASGPTEPSTAPLPPSTSSESSVSPPPTTAPPTAPTAAPRLAEARTLATSFLAYLNANDQTHATALGCEESRKLLTGQLIVMIDPPTKLAVTGPGVSVPSYYPRISVPFSGTTNGSVPLTGTVDIMDLPSRPLCVRLTSLQH
ncbi:hypothetical protein GCM10009630_03620 [Kribbella jejuensis]|uniref:Uncharacterized protein n=1 Tax=Kribbella jejuensis TaxID=236068 RepID=A0A542EU91_9ACTN|nr:hypothetical protein [Kribbella jejuensis]TQJ18931.1 hypothetical protein FB475_3085 [Kribbella jejuensis]